MVARLGIDFGSSHTVAVLAKGDGPAVPLLFDGSPVMSSAVAVSSTGDMLTARDALAAARMDPGCFEPAPKRRIDDGAILLGSKEYSVVEVIAAVLRRVRAEAERVTTNAIDQVTLTHPAAWGPRRRLVLEDAATAAGFGAAEFVPEPVAAARYFTEVLGHEIPGGHGIVVFDLGGGTFDASVVAARDADVEVLAVDGLADVGGIDIDHALTVHIGKQVAGDPLWARLVSPVTPQDLRARRALADEVRAAKETLSRHTRAEFLIPLLDTASHLTREELEALTRPLLGQAIDVTRAVIRAARLPAERGVGIFLVGGASRMPLAATMLHQATGMAPIVTEHPELVVAQGAVNAASSRSTVAAGPVSLAGPVERRAELVPPVQTRQPDPAPRHPAPAKVEDRPSRSTQDQAVSRTAARLPVRYIVFAIVAALIVLAIVVFPTEG